MSPEFMARDRRNNAIWMIGFFGFLGLAYWVAPKIPAEYNGIAVAVLLVVLGANAVIPWIFFPDQAKSEGLVCRECGGGLLNAPGQIAIATGNCPHCGKPAFDPSPNV